MPNLVDNLIGKLEAQCDGLQALNLDSEDLTEDQYIRLDSILQRLMPLVYKISEYEAYSEEQRH